MSIKMLFLFNNNSNNDNDNSNNINNNILTLADVILTGNSVASTT